MDENPAIVPTSTPVPLEQIVLPSHLSGQEGKYRAYIKEGRLIPADDDLSAVHCWLAEYTNSPHTHRAYQREAERLILWCLVEQQKPLSSLDRMDLQAYERFLKDPQPPHRWIGPRTSRFSPKWKPFAGPLKETSFYQAIAALKSLFSYLFAAGYLSGNPFQLMRLSAVNPKSVNKLPIENYLTQAQWQIVMEMTETLPDETRRERYIQSRLVYLLHLFYQSGGRISEIASGCMGDFQQVHGLWWLELHGKGRRDERIPASQALMEALMVFREQREMTTLPDPGDSSPLVPALYRDERISANMLYRILTEHFQTLAVQLNDIDPELAHRLRQATPHWLRHTRLTHMTDNGNDARHVQQFARHKDANTTARYQHSDIREWHSAVSG